METPEQNTVHVKWGGEGGEDWVPARSGNNAGGRAPWRGGHWQQACGRRGAPASRRLQLELPSVAGAPPSCPRTVPTVPSGDISEMKICINTNSVWVQ